MSYFLRVIEVNALWNDVTSIALSSTVLSLLSTSKSGTVATLLFLSCSVSKDNGLCQKCQFTVLEQQVAIFKYSNTRTTQ